jgi:ribosomal protein S18 acetylase RimI-like enzyme
MARGAASMIELRRASDSEIPAIAELMNAAYGGTGPVPGWTNVSEFLRGDRTSAAALRAELAASPNAELLVVRGDTGALRASVWLEPRYGAVWYLGSLSVDPSEQKSGLGGRVLQAAERRILDQGGGVVLIDVLNVRGPLIAWYERHGYRLTGESHPFPYEDNRYGVPQRPDLCFLLLEKSLARPDRPPRDP